MQEAGFAFLREDFTSTKVKPVTCDGGGTSTLSSSFEDRRDCQPKTVEIKTAEGGVCYDACMHEDILRQIKGRRNSSDSDQGIHRSIAEI